MGDPFVRKQGQAGPPAAAGSHFTTGGRDAGTTCRAGACGRRFRGVVGLGAGGTRGDPLVSPRRRPSRPTPARRRTDAAARPPLALVPPRLLERRENALASLFELSEELS